MAARLSVKYLFASKIPASGLCLRYLSLQWSLNDSKSFSAALYVHVHQTSPFISRVRSVWSVCVVGLVTCAKPTAKDFK